MKKFLILVVLAGGAAYAYLPYRAVGKFEEAIRAADKDALKELVDFPALRESVKTEFSKRTPGEQSLPKVLGTLVTGALVDKMVDELLTPDAVIATLKLRSSTGSSAPVSFREKRWTGLAEVIARSDGDTSLVFRLTGISGWKVVGFRDESNK